jgi:predicted metalloendopeptidase
MLNTTEIPGDRTRWGSFDELRQNQMRIWLSKRAVNNP